MSDLYSVRTSGKLKLKGEQGEHKKGKKKRKREDKEEATALRKANKVADRQDAADHGCWWKVTDFNQVTGPIALEFKNCYIKTLDDGTFTLGTPHKKGEGPDPDEILLAVRLTESQVALKSGYAKYLQVDKLGFVRGISEAVGPLEHWEPVFQDGKTALLACNNRFLSIKDADDSLLCDAHKAGPNEIIAIRSNAERKDEKLVASSIPEEERGKVGQVELNYVKKFQKFQDHKVRLCDEDRSHLVKARQEGNFHEVLLDRRSKMKADRYCK